MMPCQGNPEPNEGAAPIPRQGWDEAFRLMAELGDDRLLDDDFTGREPWDRDEWEWEGNNLQVLEALAIDWTLFVPVATIPFTMPHLTRLTQPLIRTNGALAPATWDEALDRAAAGFGEAIAQKGPTAFGLFSCSKATNEVNYLAQKFARQVIGSNNIDSCNRT